MSRRSARECAYKLIFEYLFTKERDDDTLGAMTIDADLTSADVKYINRVYDGVTQNTDALTELISASATRFRLERIFKPDLAALLLAVYEMKYMDDIPMSVSINEVVDIVKAYSTADSGAFVNGVLAGIYNTLKAQKSDDVPKADVLPDAEDVKKTDGEN